MVFNYTVDPNAEVPVMLVNKHIGYDTEMGAGIMGDQFQSELMALDAMGKRNVHVWINSVGGSVMDGMNMLSAMLHSKCKVDTYNMGVCASIAAVLFQGGRERVMMDYSKLMYHNTSGGTSDVLKNMNDMVATIVAVRSDSQIESIKKMMDRTTWIGALESQAMGLCDQVKSSSDANRGRLSKASNDAALMFREANLIINSAITKPLKMSELAKVNNKLGLIEEASPEATIKAIEAVQNKLTTVENSNKELTETVNSLKAENATLKGEKEAAENLAKTAKAEADKKIALDTVQNYVKLGKISNEESAIGSWVETIGAIGLDKAKAMLDKLPVNKTGANMGDATKGTETPDGVLVTSRAMAEVRNKLGL